MASIFSQILNMSLTGSVVILLVMLARLLLKGAPKIFSYGLWAVVLFRLLCPVAFTAPVSILDVLEPEVTQTSGAASRVSYLPAQVERTPDFIMQPVPSMPEKQAAPSEAEETALEPTPLHIAAIVWAVGAGLMLFYSVAQYALLRWKLMGAMPQKGNVYLADEIATAFVMGVFRPRIYLPSQVPEGDRALILAHERHHIRRFDHIVKLLAYVALCIHWFNPLVWAAFLLAGKDMEMSCDEAVIRQLGPQIRAAYSSALLRLTTHRKIIAGMPLAFGEGDTKGRILNMAKWKKPAKLLLIGCCVVCLCVLLVCACNPEEEKSLAELTRHTVSTDASFGVGDLHFTYPAGLTSEAQEDASKQISTVFSQNGTVFGGVVHRAAPEHEVVSLSEIALPSEWTGLDYIGESTAYPNADMAYTLVKEGKDYIQAYQYTYSGTVYLLWFYVDQADPAVQQKILESVRLGTSIRTTTKRTKDEPLSLGGFNLTIPGGFGYHKVANSLLEVTKNGYFQETTVVAGVVVRKKPPISIESGEDLERWVEGVGIDLNATGLSHAITDETDFGDISLSLTNQRTGMEEMHYFFIDGDMVYDLWFDRGQVEEKTEKTVLNSVWLKETGAQPTESPLPATAEASFVTIGPLPDGYGYHVAQNQNIQFTWGENTVGGVTLYPIPEGVYDPGDPYFRWMEQIVPDFGDDSLCYMGSITADGGWVAEFASDVPEGVERTVNRTHYLYPIGNILYDIWLDRLQLNYKTCEELYAAVQLPRTGESQTNPVEDKGIADTAFEKCLSVMEAVQGSSYRILSTQMHMEGSSFVDYRQDIRWSDGDWFSVTTVLPEGNEEGSFQKSSLYANNQRFAYTGDKWVEIAPNELDIEPWLARFPWVRSNVTYMDTLTDGDKESIMFRVDKRYQESDDFGDFYFVTFQFNHGTFTEVLLQINTGGEHRITVWESIVSLDEAVIRGEIQEEYQRAIG